MTTTFAVDIEGLAELEGGRDPQRLAFEPVANVFDEFRGYTDGERKRPTRCRVTVEWQGSPRGTILRVDDDGPGFDKPEDIWTFFGSTPKRDAPEVAGRFNAGDKQLLALAREATIQTGSTTVTFKDGKRDVTRHRSRTYDGTTVTALMPWSKGEAEQVRIALMQVIPPEGLAYTVNHETIEAAEPHATVRVTLPTVTRIEGVLRDTTRKTLVEVRKDIMGEPWLFELGMPVCSIADSEFRYSLNVMQKVPVPMSRDSVTPAYLSRAIGSVVEAAAMDGVMLLSEEDDGAAHLKRSLDWVRRPEALQAVVPSVFGDDAVRQSTDAASNARAALEGRAVINGRMFTSETRKRLERDELVPSSHQVYGTGGGMKMVSSEHDRTKCPKCGHVF